MTKYIIFSAVLYTMFVLIGVWIGIMYESTYLCNG